MSGAAESNRREFFRKSLQKAVSPLAHYVESKLPAVPLPPPILLRPPGAIPESEFLNTCRRSGHCVEVCPVQAIQLLDNPDSSRYNTPVINPDESACVICEGLYCIKICPSGALSPLTSKFDVRMGLAAVKDEVCVRSRGESCTLCVDKCPLGSVAIRINEVGKIQVLDPGCVGCGVCQLYCPTTPKAIAIRTL